MNLPRRALLVVAVAALWGMLAAGAYVGWIHGANHRDFYPRWAGARLALFEGRDLYSAETTRAMQVILYGQALPPDRDPQAFAYPAILVPLLLPFWLVGSVEAATALWEATSVLLLAGALALVRGHAPRWLIALLLLWFYVLLMIYQGQVTVVPLAALAAAFAAYAARRDALAGIVLPAAFVKPEIALVPVALVLALTLAERRWRVAAGFACGSAVLFAASFAVAGWWPPRWLDAIARYAVYARVSWAPATAWAISPVLAVVLAALVVFALSRVRWSVESAVAVGVPLGMLLLPQTLIWSLSMLALPLMLSWRARGGVFGVWLVGWLLVAGTGVADWWRVQSLLLPALTLLVAAWAFRRSRTEPAPAPALLV